MASAGPRTKALTELPTTTPRGRQALLWAALLAIATFLIGASWSGPGGTHRAPEAVSALVQGGSVALLWLAMAVGFGGVASDLLGLRRGVRAGERFLLEASLGIAIALALDSLLGTIGPLGAGRGVVAWALVALGAAALLLRWRSGRMPALPARRAIPLAAIALGPPLGVLLLAAASTPGWLWGSEFGGYDALAYHLELPKAWLVAGRLETLPTNAYSGLPSFVEAAFLHLFMLAGGPDVGAIAAQYLAVAATCIGAALCGCLARRLVGRGASVVAAVLYLATPWTVVVGSLAYNDGFVPMLLAAALLIVERERRAGRLGVGGGLLVAAACGAKLTALGFVALPMALVVALRRPRVAPAALAIALVVGAALLAPWLIRNALATGNPTHPLTAPLVGTLLASGDALWTPEQSELFMRGHRSDAGALERATLLLRRWLAFGVGANPHPGEPWGMLWSLLPIAGCAGLVALVRRRAGVLLGALLAVQLLFWLLATHLQSRFLLPTVVPLAIAASALLAGLAWRRSVVIALVAASLLPLLVFRGERAIPDAASGRLVGTPAFLIGGRGFATGDVFAAALRGTQDPERQAALLASAPVALFVNHLLPADTGILLVGESRLFHLRRPVVASSVWDRGLFDRVVAEDPDAPEAWTPALRAEGIRYLVLDLEMLDRWRASGWLNPALTPERLARFVESGRVLHRFSNGALLVDITASSR